MMLPFILGFIFVIFAVFAAVLINRTEKDRDQYIEKLKKLTIKYNNLYNAHEMLMKENVQLRRDLTSRYRR
jgi:hypothetical protein